MNYAALGFAVATATWALSPTPAAARHAQQQQGDHWTWHGAVAAGKTIEIRGVSGDVVATLASGNEVEVTADKHARHSDPADVQIQVVQGADGVTICAVYPGRGNTCEEGHSHMNVRDNNDVQVDFTVHVPRGVTFHGVTVNGDVEATGLGGPTDVETVNGSATIETSSGQARAKTVIGSVTATVGSTSGSGSLDFETVNGAITLSLPAGLNADVAAETVNGSITTDFPIQVQGRMSPRELRGQIGSGGRELHLETVNGSIRIRRLGQ